MASPARRASGPHNLGAALQYARSGFAVFPLGVRSKHPRISKEQGGHGCHDATTDAAQITAWWTEHSQGNIGIATGAPSGVVVLDVDPKNGATYDELAERYDLPETLTALSGRGDGGRHLYFQHPGFAVSNDSKGIVIGKGYDLKGDGGYVVAPPSIHPDSGKPYTWLNEGTAIAPMPAWLLDAVKARQEHQARPANVTPLSRFTDDGSKWLGEALAKAHSGQVGRDDAGHALAIQLLCNQVADPEGVMRAYAAACPAKDHPYTEADALRNLESARTSRIVQKGEPARRVSIVDFSTARHKPAFATDSSSPQTEPGTAEPDTENILDTDTGNAIRFRLRHGDKARYCAKWGKWLIWDGRRWVLDETGHVMRLAKDTARSIFGEAERAADEVEVKRLAKHALRTQSEKSLRAMLSLAQSELPITPDDLDKDHWLLNTPSGTVDLRTGVLRPHRREDYITKITDAPYDPSTPTPTFDAFLQRIMAGNETMIGYLRRFLGYCLTGDTSEQAFPIAVGKGANGKTVLSSAVEGLMGDYAMHAAAETFMAKDHSGSVSNDVAALRGSRLVTVTETEQGKRLAEARIKEMTGGDRVTARFMRSEYFTFTPTFKVFIATNHPPQVRGTDEGIWRRIKVVPFNVQIPEGEQDKRLGAKLKAEYAGILAWLVRGCLEWQRDGMQTPETVTSATAAQRDDMDILGAFLRETVIADAGGRVYSTVLYEQYADWCEKSGERWRMTNRQLAAALRDRGWQSGRGHGNKPVWIGYRIRLDSDPEPTPTDTDRVTKVTVVTGNPDNSHKDKKLRVYAGNTVTSVTHAASALENKRDDEGLLKPAEVVTGLPSLSNPACMNEKHRSRWNPRATHGGALVCDICHPAVK